MSGGAAAGDRPDLPPIRWDGIADQAAEDATAEEDARTRKTAEEEKQEKKKDTFDLRSPAPGPDPGPRP